MSNGLMFSHDAVWCCWCNTGCMHYAQLETHLRGQRHCKGVLAHDVKMRIHVRAKHMKELKSRVSSLGLQRWRWEIDSLLLMYVQDDEDASSSVVLNKAKKVLTKYELMERLSLLELAVWKASLASDAFFSTMEELDAYWTLDRNFNPVAYANERRVTNGITVIIQGVLPFLV